MAIYKRGNKILIQQENDKRRTKTVTVIMHDTMQGILAVDASGEYTWYREQSNEEHGWEGPYWTVIKKQKKKRNEKVATAK